MGDKRKRHSKASIQNGQKGGRPRKSDEQQKYSKFNNQYTEEEANFIFDKLDFSEKKVQSEYNLDDDNPLEQNEYGYIILNIQKFMEIITKLCHHVNKCEEYRRFAFTKILNNKIIQIMCVGCKKNIEMNLSNYNQTFQCQELSLRLILSNILSGKGFTDLNKLFIYSSIQNIITKKNYQDIEFKLFKSIQAYSQNNMKMYALKSKEDALNQKFFSTQNFPAISVQIDGGWSKCSYKSKFTALSAEMPFIDNNSEKIIHLEVLNRYCYLCSNQQDIQSNISSCSENSLSENVVSSLYESDSRYEEYDRNSHSDRSYSQTSNSQISGSQRQSFSSMSCMDVVFEDKQDENVNKNKNKNIHECYKNFDGGATEMEACMALRGAKFIENNYQIHLVEIVADGDSSSIKSIQSESSYQIYKIECQNHLIKNLKNALYSYKKQQSKNEQLNKFLTKQTIDKIGAYAYNICKQNQTDLSSQNLNTTENRLLQICFHLNNQHHKCEKDVCTSLKQNNPIYDQQIINQINQNCFSYIIQKISFMKDSTKNLAENFHSMRSSLDYSKSRNYIQKHSFLLRSYIAQLFFNESVKWIPSYVLEQLQIKDEFLQKSINSLEIYYEQKRFRKSKAQKIYNKVYSQKDKHYGFAEVYLNENEIIKLFAMMKDYYLQNIQINNKQIEQIQNQTIEQSQSQQWIDERMKRITGSLVGKICKKYKKTHSRNIISNKLYQNNLYTLEMQYGLQKEEEGVKRIEQQYNCKIKKCGFQIAKKLRLLGSSADGKTSIHRKQCLIEIKWAAKIKNRNLTIKQLIEQKQNQFCQKEVNNVIQLKKTHDYFYQIQSQMFCYEIGSCLFSYFTESDSFYQIIKFDQVFFNNNCADKLIRFYFTSLLPELVLRNRLHQKDIIDLEQYHNQKLIDDQFEQIIKTLQS